MADGSTIDHFAEAYDALDPNGNITIKWDIMQWTPDGYVVSISKQEDPHQTVPLSAKSWNINYMKNI